MPCTPGADGEPLPDGVEVFRLAKQTNNGKFPPEAFALSSEDKKQSVPRASTWASDLTTPDQADVLTERKFALAGFLLVDDVRRLCQGPSDNILAIAMKDAGVSLLERKIIYEAVRQFGQSAWDENRRARQAGMSRTVAPPYDQVPLSGTWAEYREWLRAARVKDGMEYRVHASVCAAADSANQD
jgi:hypothetical protein